MEVSEASMLLFFILMKEVIEMATKGLILDW